MDSPLTVIIDRPLHFTFSLTLLELHTTTPVSFHTQALFITSHNRLFVRADDAE
jgi:hypothetical protein